MLILVWVTRLYFHTQLLGDTTTGDVLAHILLQNGVKVGLSNHRTSTRALGLLGKFGAETEGSTLSASGGRRAASRLRLRQNTSNPSKTSAPTPPTTPPTIAPIGVDDLPELEVDCDCADRDGDVEVEVEVEEVVDGSS